MNFRASSLVEQLPDHYFSSLHEKVAAYQHKGIDVINLATGHPDQPTPDEIVHTLKEAVADKENQGYPS